MNYSEFLLAVLLVNVDHDIARAAVETVVLSVTKLRMRHHCCVTFHWKQTTIATGSKLINVVVEYFLDPYVV